MMFTNIWYVARSSNEVTDQPVRAHMLGRDFVLFRDQAGKAVCLSGVCPHRGADLSQGKCEDDGTLGCPFQSLRFDHTGKCTKVPSNEDPVGEISAAARVDSYPTEEKYGYIWVFLGDDLQSATPIFEMPEYDDPEWCHVTHTVTWNANAHWAKQVDLDHVHLPIVHGIGFGGDNPVRPLDHTIVHRDDGFETEIIGKPDITKGRRLKLRDKWTKVTSKFKFFIPGFASRAKVPVGSADSGVYNIFYQMCTPIDEEHTQIHFTFFRNFMMEPENHAEHLRHNCRNIYQDKSIAERIMPKRAPDVPVYPSTTADREDKLMGAYWQVLQGLRRNGWQIDRVQLAALDEIGDYRTIPSPARRNSRPEQWVFEEVPRIPAEAAGA